MLNTVRLHTVCLYCLVWALRLLRLLQCAKHWLRLLLRAKHYDTMRLLVYSVPLLPSPSTKATLTALSVTVCQALTKATYSVPLPPGPGIDWAVCPWTLAPAVLVLPAAVLPAGYPAWVTILTRFTLRFTWQLQALHLELYLRWQYLNIQQNEHSH